MASLRSWLGAAVFGLGVVVSLVWAYVNIRPLIEAIGAGSGDVGTVSSPPYELLQYFVPPVVAFFLASRVRGRGNLARRLRRLHLLTSVCWILALGLLGVVIVSGGGAVSGLSGLWLMATFGTLVGGALWLPVQTVFSAAFLGVLIRGKHRVRVRRHTLQTSPN